MRVQILSIIGDSNRNLTRKFGREDRQSPLSGCTGLKPRRKRQRTAEPSIVKPSIDESRDRAGGDGEAAARSDLHGAEEQSFVEPSIEEPSIAIIVPNKSCTDVGILHGRVWVVRVGGDDGELRQGHHIYEEGGDDGELRP
jgi:hypothetical protein